MKTYGEGFNQELEGLPGKPAALLKRGGGKQPGAVVMDVENPNNTDPFGSPLRPPRDDQPRVRG